MQDILLFILYLNLFQTIEPMHLNMDKNLLKIGCEKVYEIEIILKDIYFIIKKTMIYIYIYLHIYTYNSCVCVCVICIFLHIKMRNGGFFNVNNGYRI